MSACTVLTVAKINLYGLVFPFKIYIPIDLNRQIDLYRLKIDRWIYIDWFLVMPCGTVCSYMYNGQCRWSIHLRMLHITQYIAYMYKYRLLHRLWSMYIDYCTVLCSCTSVFWWHGWFTSIHACPTYARHANCSKSKQYALYILTNCGDTWWYKGALSPVIGRLSAIFKRLVITWLIFFWLHHMIRETFLAYFPTRSRVY